MENLKVTKGTFIKSKQNVNKMMFHLLVALLPIICFTFYKNGVKPYLDGNATIFGMFYPLIFILVGVVTTTIVECVYLLFKRKKGKGFLKTVIDSYCFLPGLFMALVLPINTPLWIVVVGGVCASLSKIVFGGFGKNIFNPALVGWFVITMLFSATIANNGGYLNPTELDAVTSATPLTNMAMSSTIGSYSTLVEPYGSLWNFFIGTIPGSLGETSALLCLVAFIYLTATKTIKWKIPVIYVLTVFFMTYLIGGSHGLDAWYPTFQIMSGGLLFGAVFMTTDPVTSPVTPIGQILYGLFLGILTVMFRYMTSFAEGVALSILIMNIFVKLLDKIGSQARFRLMKAIIPFVIGWALILGIGFYVGSSLPEETGRDIDYSIISKETKGSTTTYIATQKGYAGNIKGKIVIEKGKIVAFEILEQNDSFFGNLENANYMDKIVQNSPDLDKLDTITGTTVSSNAVKKLAQNTLLDYEKGSEDIETDEEIKDEEVKPVGDFNILSKETIDNITTYIVTQKGFCSVLKLEVVITDGIVTDYNVLEQNDSYFKIVENANYTDILIENQNDLEELDAVGGATISSNALKKALQNVLLDYQTNE